MLDLCEYLSVCRKASMPEGSIIEYCDSFDAVLTDFVIVCQEYQMPNVRRWIQDNIKVNVDHCLRTFDKSPQKILEFVVSMEGIGSYTSELVKAAGGIQGFLDKYGAPERQLAQEEVKSASAQIPEIAQGQTLVTEQILASEQAAGFEQELPSESEFEQGLPPEPMSEQELSSEAVPEPSLQRTVEPIKEINRVEVVNITKEVRSVMEYDPNLIKDITDKDISESLRVLRSLNDAIALDGLDPGKVLSDEKLKEVYKKMVGYPPAFFKEFMLHLISHVETNTNRYRVSSFVDDFANFINGEVS